MGNAEYMGTWLPTQAVTMKSFVLSSLFAVGLSAPTTHVNSGLPAGPLTPAFGDAVQTPKGLRSLALEGFSEDLNQDGFVDPIGQAVVAAPVAYTVPHLVAAAAIASIACCWISKSPVKKAGGAASSCFASSSCFAAEAAATMATTNNRNFMFEKVKLASNSQFVDHLAGVL